MKAATKPKAYAYVRFSTPDQQKGDSRARQNALIKKFIQEKDIELDTELHFSDLGVSAFRGDNLEAGLGKFQTAIRQKRIAPGSYLLIESLDRLSRQSALQAMPVFMDIIKAGITIVTLSDASPKEYSNAIDYPDLMFAMVVMSRAYEESAIKSQRLQSSWSHKRKNAAKQVMTKQCPTWMKYDEKQGKFILIPDRAKIVARIFKLARDGAGDETITNILNQEKIPPFGRNGKFWNKAYLNDLMNNPAVMGYLQPYRYVYEQHPLTGRQITKRVPEGEPIENYFPKAIDKQLYYQVRKGRTARRKSGGRKGTHFPNLFTKIAKCGYCGTTMEYVNKGSGNRNYLCCSRARQGAGCKCEFWRYHELEETLLKHCGRIELSQALHRGTKDEKQTLLDNHAALEGELFALREKERALIETLSELNRQARQSVTSRLNEVAGTISSKEQELSRMKTAVDSFADPEVVASQVATAVAEFRKRDKSVTRDERFLLRMHVNQLIQQAIRAIGMYKHGLSFGKFPPLELQVMLVIFQSGAWQLIGEDGTLLSQTFIGQDDATTVQIGGTLSETVTSAKDRKAFTNFVLLVGSEAEKLKNRLGIPNIAKMENTKVVLAKHTANLLPKADRNLSRAKKVKLKRNAR